MAIHKPRKPKQEVPLSFEKATNLMHRTGTRLMLMHHANLGSRWYVVPGGHVTEDTARKIIQQRNVIAGKDGLLPGMSQTWRVR